EQFLVEKFLLSKQLRPNIALALVLVIVAYLFGGAWAIILVIPLFTTLQHEAQIFIARRLTKKGYSLDTGDYISPVGAEMYAEAPDEEPAAEEKQTQEDVENSDKK
ncbi:MAG: hypothetical protein IKD11_04700, partial [Oscillospiraceae bacterium]|nr:hypothetical protein [Oscillospiraceae bacterium]